MLGVMKLRDLVLEKFKPIKCGGFHESRDSGIDVTGRKVKV